MTLSYERYNRNELSITEIVQQYGISVQWAYTIIRTGRDKMREQREAERQAQRNKEMQHWSRED